MFLVKEMELNLRGCQDILLLLFPLCFPPCNSKTYRYVLYLIADRSLGGYRILGTFGMS